MRDDGVSLCAAEALFMAIFDRIGFNRTPRALIAHSSRCVLSLFVFQR